MGYPLTRTNIKLLLLLCTRLALPLQKIGCGSEEREKNLTVFLPLFSRLALPLCFTNVGGGSAKQTKNTFLLYSALALHYLCPHNNLKRQNNQP